MKAAVSSGERVRNRGVQKNTAGSSPCARLIRALVRMMYKIAIVKGNSAQSEYSATMWKCQYGQHKGIGETDVIVRSVRLCWLAYLDSRHFLPTAFGQLKEDNRVTDAPQLPCAM